MNFPAALTIPVHHRTDVGTYLAIAAALAIGFATSLLYRAPTITVTHNVKQSIQSQYGKPDSSMAGATINKALTGLTCDVFQAAKVVLCHA